MYKLTLIIKFSLMLITIKRAKILKNWVKKKNKFDIYKLKHLISIK